MAEEKEFSLDLSKILQSLNKHRTAISLLILLGIFYLSFSIRLTTVNQPYLLAADPHFWYRMTKYIAEDNVPEYDPLRLHPEYIKFNPGFFPYAAAYSYKLVRFFTGIDFYRFLFWFPAFVAALSVFPAFWIGKELHSNKAGLFAAFFIGFTPSFLSRSMAGFFDTDCMVILFSLLTVALFLSAYNRVDASNLKKKSPIILSILAALSLSVFFFTWPGGSAYIPWLFIGLFFFHYLYRIVIAKGNNFKEKLKHSYLFFRGHLLVYIILFVSFICFTFPFQGFQPINSIIKVTTFFQTGKAEGGIFPNVWVSISEEMSASLTEVVMRVGTPIFIFGIIGLVILFLFFIFNFGKKASYPETFFFMFVWIAPTLYGSLWAIRFAQMLAIPMSICAGIALGVLFDLSIKMIKKYADLTH